MDSPAVLQKLLRVAIGTDSMVPIEGKVDWKSVYQLALSQEVELVALDGYQQLESLALIDENAKLEQSMKLVWAGVVSNLENNYQHYRKTVFWLADLFRRQGVRMLILKGMACGQYYPRPEHRGCGDLDIYLNGDYEKGNSILEAQGVDVVKSYYRHSEALWNGLRIENHRMLSSDRGPKCAGQFESELKSLAADAFNCSDDVVVRPSATFNALYLPWHVSFHFAFERVSIRYLLDWTLFLMHEAAEIDMQRYEYAKKHYLYGFSRFADVLTALSVDQLALPLSILPQSMVDSYMHTDKNLCRRVFGYMLMGKPLLQSQQKVRKWIVKAWRACRDSWKYPNLYDVSVGSYLWYCMQGLIKSNKME